MSIAVITCRCYKQRQGDTVQENGMKVKEAAVTYFKLIFSYYLEEGAGWYRLPVVFEWKAY
jgi:hypothetical protein